MLEQLNHTFIHFVPKGKNAKACAKLKVLLCNLISESECAYIPKRSIG